MNKKQKGMIIGFGAVLGLILLLVYGQAFSIFQETVWFPKYWTAECVPKEDGSHLLLKSIPSHTDEGKFYKCANSESGSWIPLAGSVSCEYIPNDFDTLQMYVCNKLDATKDDLKNTNICVKEEGKFSSYFSGDNDREISVRAGYSVYINTGRLLGTSKLSARYPSYGLKVRQADNLLLPQTNTCLLSSASSVDLHTINAKGQNEVKPGFPFNVVTAFTEGRTNQAVTLQDVENGKPIYITRQGHYRLIKTAEDGFKYVDMLSPEIPNPRIECIPGTGCTNEARRIELSQQSCDKFGGVPTGYAPTTQSGKLCTYECKADKLVQTSECIEIKGGCPDDKPQLDPKTGQCTSTIASLEGNKFNPLPLIIIGIVFLFTLLIIVMMNKNKRRK